ncbi:excinuclease ABC subunit UvrA [Porphyromonas crevioricanis]|uniref:UvrABC system protein A n=1 Tax=Porphyromonas crevioricanis TaxID=393921 RepID=A0AB34PG44_9PORP|nr:excinuclease ABC subunit UvrA [Porphyromonas crevioricanis]KGN94219.1 excinuclease ABC subunit A [Porphyromonas crevioricanis]
MKQTVTTTDEYISLKGVRVNNLKEIDLEIPRGRLVVVSGLSGSGKSSLAFDTLYAEGQRRYVESLSAYARQFLGRMPKPECTYIKGIPPAIAIEQHVSARSPRSTVATSTELYEYFRLLFARIGKTISPISGEEVKREGIKDVVEAAMNLAEGSRCYLLVDLSLPAKRRKNDYSALDLLLRQGYSRMMWHQKILRISDYLQDPSQAPVEELKLMIDRLLIDHSDSANLRSRLADSAENAFYEGHGHCLLRVEQPDGQWQELLFSKSFERDGLEFKDPTPQLFSFNTPIGACPTCNGFGAVMGIDEQLVIPDPTLSVYEGAISCWSGVKSREWLEAFMQNASAYSFPIHKPYRELATSERELLWKGVKAQNGYPKIEGIDDYFAMLQAGMHKIQNRVRLAHFRGRTICPDCKGARLSPEALCVRIGGLNIAELCDKTIAEATDFFMRLNLSEQDQYIAKRLLNEINQRLYYLVEVGLGYLGLSRKMDTLSGGESQRISLATQLGSNLVGSLYVLDEPTVGLHQRDTARLIAVMEQLRDAGNTVVVVEHDEEVIRKADFLIDMGPEAGSGGGRVVYSGDPRKIDRQTPGYTAAFLSGREQICIPAHTRPVNRYIEVKGAYLNNLKNLDVRFPLNCLTVVSGVSGSGKTTLVRDIFYENVRTHFYEPGGAIKGCKSILGDLNLIDDVQYVDQYSIGRSTRSNPVTYIGAYNHIRELYARQPLSDQMGYMPYFFSFNKEGGRCESCKGEGVVTVEMQFMADLTLECEECHGKRFRKEILDVEYRGVNIYQLLNMSVDEAIEFFSQDRDVSICKTIVNKLNSLRQVGLGYIKLGQSSSSLSGGENQRVKLASYLGVELLKPTLFIFDEPTTGLHLKDISTLLDAFHALIDKGHSIVVVEHNIEVIKSADYLIDLGPEGGENGGHLLVSGSPQEASLCGESMTAKYLRPYFPQG